MKIKTVTTILLTTLLCCSCNVEEPAGKPNDGASALHVGISAIQTKTWLDYANKVAGQPIKVYWSDGDKINVNGISSLGLSVEESSKTTMADFSLYGVEAPYNVIYPASIVTELVYDEEGYISVELPSSQAYHPTSFAEGSAIMCGYSEGNDVTLSNLCAAVRVNVQGTDNVVSATVVSSSAPLCGQFKLNPQSASLVPVEGLTELSLEFTESITLSDGGVDFFFTIPAGDYSEGLSFFFKNIDGRNLECIWRPQTALEAGKLYSFNDVEYIPGAKDITTVEDWEEFAAAVNAQPEETEKAEAINKYLYKGGFVRLGADIQAETLTSITNEFPYVFDGNGHSLTHSATSSLFDKLSGEIRDLTLNGELTLDGEGAPFVRQLFPGASIKRCTNNMNVTFDIHNKGVYVAGFAAVLTTLKTEGEVITTTIKDCTNNGSITGTSSCQDLTTAYNVAIGGLAGDVRSGGSGNVPYSIVMENCKNTGKIILTPSPPSDHTTIGMGLTGIGGLVGTFRSSLSITMDDCDNSGNITLSAKEMKTDKGMKAYSICMGGIIGCGTYSSGVGLTLTGHDISITGCDNSGVLYNCGDNYSTTATGNNKVYTGGLAGALVGLETDYAVVQNCTSTGDIFPYDIVDGEQSVVSARPAYCAVAGGLIGYGGYLDMSDCVVNCQIGNGKRPMVAWGGMVGFLVRPFRLKDSSIHMHGYFQRVTAFKMNRAVIAVVPCKCGSKEADVAGSQITGNLLLSGYILSSGSTLSSDDKSNLSATLTTKVCYDIDKAKSYLVAGESFTSNAGVDFSSANITYSAD